MKTPIRMLVATLGLTMLSTVCLHAGNGNPNPGIVPPHAKYKGKTAGEWTVAWWQWVLGTPGKVQMEDATGDFAYVNNNGADGVFFLAKTWAGNQERTIEIPAGTPLYVPLMGWGVTDTPGGFLEDYGSVESLYENLIGPDILGVHDLCLEINGESVDSLEDGNLHYLNFVEDGDDHIVPIWEADDPEVGELAGYEFSVILTPLPPGEHTIRLKGQWGYDENGEAIFSSDVTYHITVTPGKNKK